LGFLLNTLPIVISVEIVRTLPCCAASPSSRALFVPLAVARRTRLRRNERFRHL